MIAVRGVVIGAEGDAEIAAGTIFDGVQEFRLRSIAFPETRDADRASVGENKGVDINGVGAGVLTAERRDGGFADNISAGVDAHVLHAFDVRVQILPCRRLHLMREPHRQRRRHFAADLVDAQVRAACVRDVDSVAPSAAFFKRRIGNRRCANQRRGERRFALADVVSQCG